MFTTYRIFDENETTHEYGNRIYKGVIGFRWVVFKDGELIDTPLFKTLKDVKRNYPNVVKAKAI